MSASAAFALIMGLRVGNQIPEQPGRQNVWIVDSLNVGGEEMVKVELWLVSSWVGKTKILHFYSVCISENPRN